MPKQSRRREAIIRMVRERGFVSVDDLSRTFEVTPQTIRRDLNSLCRQGPYQRYHGGIGCERLGPSQARERQVEAPGEAETRHTIARLVAEQIPEGASLFIGCGRTAAAVAAALGSHKRLRVISNSLQVADSLTAREDIELTITGGQLRGSKRCVVGDAALEMITRFRVDYAIVGVSAIDQDGSLLHRDYDAARLVQAMMENARSVFLVAEQGKVGRSAMARLGVIQQVSTWFTDRQPPESLQPLLSRFDINVRHPSAGLS